MTLHIHRAERADGLVGALAELIAQALPDPFEAELIAVPTRGMERWLMQQCSASLGASPGRRDGVCANVEFPFPRRLVGQAVAQASGIDPDADPWLPEHAMWPLLEVVEACLAEPWMATLAAHLGHPRRREAGDGDRSGDQVRRARRLPTIRHLADLFDRYALARPEMVRAWSRGEDDDGAGGELAPDTVWQAELWRRLRERISAPDPAQRRESACERLREQPEIARLPQRVSLFGLTRLPAGQLEVLRALAAGRDVHLFLLHPSPALWERVAQRIEHRPPVVRRAEDPVATLADNRLLASWGQDARELQLVIGAGNGSVDHHHRVEDEHRVEHRDESLLAMIQADVRADRSPPGPPPRGGNDVRPVLDPGDRSLQVHACHGRARQVEVLRDAILHLLADDRTLEPRDVIVMCPDIEVFAPLIGATFGATEMDDVEPEATPAGVETPAGAATRAATATPAGAAPAGARRTDLRVRLADRAVRQTNPLLGVLATLLELPEQRLTASQLLDLADREPVRRRFELDDDDLARIREWVAQSGIRWGLDAPHRTPFRLDSLAGGTWRAGMNRILLGVSMTEDDQRLFGGVLALDDVESGVIDLAGRFAELVDRLGTALDALREPKTLGDWATAIVTALDGLSSPAQREEWQRAELERLLAEVVRQAAVSGAEHRTRITLAEVRSLLAARLQGRPTRASFRSGHLTVCTLVPMRSVPHRVVCLLGLDDGSFPRQAPRDGDDLILDAPHVGDRDPRTEDRQLLLDALLAATDRLLITYTGNDERTNAPRPPAVPVGELLDQVDRTVRTGTGTGTATATATGSDPARARVLLRHPLQPFDPRSFVPGELARGRPWSFDRVNLQGARALISERSQPEPFLAGPLAGEASSLVEVEDLVRFAARPVRTFLRRRLGVRVGEHSDEVQDALAVELDALERWGVGQRLLDGRLSGADLDACLAAERARGTLPAGELSTPVIERVRPVVEQIVAHAQALAPGIATGSLDVRVDLPGGRRITGTVPGVCGEVLRTVTFARVNARHRLAAWVRLLALTAAHPERPFEVATIGRARSGAHPSRVTIVRIPALAPDAATRRQRSRRHLLTLLDLYDRGMREPAPLYCLSSAAYAQAAATGRNAASSGRQAWESEWRFDKEDKELEHQLVLGGVLTFEELLADPPRADEQGAGWDSRQTTRFGRYACRLWEGVLGSEVVSEH
ncbi:MAG: exodeoxyribonuclease V subunit gamma [Solirubrobacteraceae bacterium]